MARNLLSIFILIWQWQFELFLRLKFFFGNGTKSQSSIEVVTLRSRWCTLVESKLTPSLPCVPAHSLILIATWYEIKNLKLLLFKFPFKFSLFLFLIFAFSACSSNKKNSQDQKAVSVFSDLNLITIDNSLKNIPIKIPDQMVNKFWSGSNNDNNQQFDNLALASKINNSKSIFAGYTFASSNDIVFAPIIVNNRIYILDARGNLTAFNLSNYKKIFRSKLVKGWGLDKFNNGKISYANGKIFAVTGANLVLKIDAVDGKIIWSKQIGSIPNSAPIIDDDQVLVITNDNKTYCLNDNDGNIKWIHSGVFRPTAILGNANPVIYKQYLIAAYSSGEIYALNKKTGEVLWSYDLNLSKAIDSDFILNDIDATPIIKNDVVYAIGNGGLMMAINLSNGNILWQKELASISDFWIAGDFIYLINSQNQLLCLSKNNGGVKWFVSLAQNIKEKNPNQKIFYNGLIMAGGNLIMTNSNRQLVLASPLNGKINQIYNLNQKIYHSPIVVDKKLYLHIVGRFNSELLIFNQI